MFYSLITFQCRECGLIHKGVIKNNQELTFSTESGLHSKEQCLTKDGYFKCIICKEVDTTRKFEKVYY